MKDDEEFVNIGIVDEHDYSADDISNYGKILSGGKLMAITLVGGYYVILLYSNNNKIN